MTTSTSTGSDALHTGTGPSLQDAIDAAGSPVELLRNAQSRPTAFSATAEYTNWRSEQRAWRESCALLDQSHHMTDLFLSGPGAGALLAHVGVNSFANFPVDRAKQFVAVNDDGQLIGDSILVRLGEDEYNLVGGQRALDWVQFHAETGDFDVEIVRDDNSSVRRGAPRLFRYELQGPTAAAIVERITGAPTPRLGLFHVGRFPIAGLEVRGIRHGMAGQPGFELFGPWEQADRVLDAILAAGGDFGLVRAGAIAYSTANLESGWVPTPLPAIYSGESTAAYRRWVRASRAGSLGGSFFSEDIEDYYLTPWDLDYGRNVAFDHEFIGRDALARIAEDPRRRKVTLVWNPEDVRDVLGSILSEGTPAKYMSLPKSRYAVFQVDRVLDGHTTVGQSFDCGYIANEHAYVSLAAIDLDRAEPGTELTVLWGEDPVSRKPEVEPHRQVAVRATVAPWPYSREAREQYRKPVA